MPSKTSFNAKDWPGPKTRASQASARMAPPAKAAPLTAATSGFGKKNTRSNIASKPVTKAAIAGAILLARSRPD